MSLKHYIISCSWQLTDDACVTWGLFYEPGMIETPFRGCLMFPFYLIEMLANSGGLYSLTCCGGKKNSFSQINKEMCTPTLGFLSEIMFMRRAPFRRRLDSFLTGHSCWFLTVWRVRTYLCLQTPAQRQMSGLRKRPAFLLVRSEGVPAAWLNDVTHTLATLPHRAFLNLPQLTSQRTDKWIDCIKMAEEIQTQDWKWMVFPSTATTRQITLSGIIYAVYRQ